MSTFDDAVNLVLQHEGGYVSDPNDPGGETNFGISKRSYPALDIKHLTRPEAIEIYRRDWWERYGMDRVPAFVAPKLFDAMVNMGPSTAVKCLQRALRADSSGRFNTEDGELRTETIQWMIQRATTGNGATPIQTAFRSELAAYYRELVARVPDKTRFLAGWLNRAYS